MKQWVVVSSCIALILVSALGTTGTLSQDSASDTSQIAKQALNDIALESECRNPSLRPCLCPLRTALPIVEQTKAISAREIHRYIDQLKDNDCIPLAELWEQLGITTKEGKCYWEGEVSIFELDLDREPGPEIMLRFYSSSLWTSRYLIFKADAPGLEAEWKLLCCIDLEDRRYDLTNHRVVSSADHHWLVLKALMGRGSGYSLYHDLWYEIDEKGARVVLTYPSDKYLYWRDTMPTLEAETRIIDVITASGTTTVNVEFSASYLMSDSAQREMWTPLWTKKQRGTFVRHPDANEFSYAEAGSELSRKEVCTIYDGEGPYSSDILRFNYNEIETIVSGTDEKKREWLRSYLEISEDTPEKRKLLSLL